MLQLHVQPIKVKRNHLSWTGLGPSSLKLCCLWHIQPLSWANSYSCVQLSSGEVPWFCTSKSLRSLLPCLHYFTQSVLRMSLHGFWLWHHSCFSFLVLRKHSAIQLLYRITTVLLHCELRVSGFKYIYIFPSNHLFWMDFYSPQRFFLIILV